MSSFLTSHFDRADGRNQEDEDRRFAAQREWEGEMEKRHHDAQLNLMRQMMQQTLSMMMGFVEMSRFSLQPTQGEIPIEILIGTH